MGWGRVGWAGAATHRDASYGQPPLRWFFVPRRAHRREAPVAVAVACDVPDPPAQEGLVGDGMGSGWERRTASVVAENANC